MSEYVKVAKKSEIPPGTMKAVNVNDEEVLIANVRGRYYAIQNRCPHEGGSLSEGSLEGGVVTCPRHGSKFDVLTGRVIDRPKIFLIKIPVSPVKTFDVEVEGKFIKVRKGDMPLTEVF